MIVLLMIIENAAQNIISLCTIVVSIVALVYAVQQGKISQRHNELSVQPYLDFTVSYSKAHSQYFLSLTNVGLGPARVTKHVFLIDGLTTIEISKRENISSLSEFSKFLGFDAKFNWKFITAKTVIPVGERIDLISYEDGDYKIEQAELFRQAMKRIKIKTSYTSLYKTKHSQTIFDGEKDIPS